MIDHSPVSRALLGLCAAVLLPIPTADAQRADTLRLPLL